MNQPFVKQGITLSIVSIIITMAVYLIDATYLTSGLLSIGSLAISIYFMVKAVKQFKNSNGGYASFGEALIQSFGTAMVSVIIVSIFQWFLYNVIDPGLADMLKETMLTKFEDMESLLGEEATEAMIEGIEAQDFTMSIGRTIQNIGFAGIFLLILSLVVSAFTKKSREGIA